MLIESTKLYVAYAHGDDEPFTRALADAVAQRAAALLRANGGTLLPAFEVLPVHALPAPAELGGVSVVLVVLPQRERGFTDVATARLEKLLEANPDPAVWEARIIPVGRSDSDGYLPPGKPLDKLQGIAVPTDLSDERAVINLTTASLINASLMLHRKTQATLFISYAHADGWALAEVLADRLAKRGYRVFRDENRDRDDMIGIPIGAETQKVIENEVLRHGFLLLLDTPGADRSRWVHAEVRTAFGFLLPILPVVVSTPESKDPKRDPPAFGRFREVRELQREVRLSTLVLGKQATDPVTREVDLAMDRIEENVLAILLEHNTCRRQLITASCERFKELAYEWSEKVPERLLYRIEKSMKSRFSPNLVKRYLVGCSPYARLLRSAVKSLCDACADGEHEEDRPPQQYRGSVLVHNAIVSTDDLVAALEGFQSVVAIRPEEIAEDVLP
jgi:hypothetical protein